MADQEYITIEQLYKEEREAILEMLVSLRVLRSHCEPDSADYYEVVSTIIQYEQTRDYLTDRLNGDVPPKCLDGRL